MEQQMWYSIEYLKTYVKKLFRYYVSFKKKKIIEGYETPINNLLHYYTLYLIFIIIIMKILHL